jgi:hypothetical protein
MSGMFPRIARRHDGSDEPVMSDTAAEPVSEHAPERADDAPIEQIDAGAAAPDGEQPTALQPAAPAPAETEAETTIQPAPSAPAPVAAPAAPTPAAGEIPATDPPPRRPSFRTRGRMRRRLRYLRKLRELQVRDLGGLTFDLRRFERKRDDLVAQKIDQIRACDDELHALELALDERRELRDVREPGIGGTCPRCFAIFGSADRFCAKCGAALGGAVQGPAQVPLMPAPAADAAPASASATPAVPRSTPPAAPHEASGTAPER